MVAMPRHQTPHPWRLVAPWYRWPRAALPSSGRGTAPALQKFSGPGFIPGFLADPQHSLVFDPEADVVSTVDLLPVVSGGNLAGRVAALFAAREDGTPVRPSEARGNDALLKSLRRIRLTPSGLRKLYQPVHDRFYLVVCELHCDVPGFPTVPRDEVCQAGFVVRRRRRTIPTALAQEAAKRAKALRGAEADLAELSQSSPLRGDLSAKRQAQIEAMAGKGTLEPARATLEAAVLRQRGELQAWFKANGVEPTIEGWFPDRTGAAPHPSLGAWQALAVETADPEPDEQVLPLFPLIPDPAAHSHDAAGRAIYYGLVPVASLQHDAAGRPRYDDTGTYEVRCFVRRHRQGCPRTGRKPDCHGEVIWSLPSEPYRIAAPFDPIGSANRPVTIKMPDLGELAAQIAARPRGSQSPVRFVQPQHLSPDTSDPMKKGSMGGPAICFFSIPLITIVALFLLNLFLPIVVFIFQLWFLLLFRFCIPPQVKFDAALDAELAATPPSVDLDADAAISIQGADQTAEALNGLLAAGLKGKFAAGGLRDPGVDLGPLSNNALATLHRGMADNVAFAERQPPGDPGSAPSPVDYAGALVWEPRRSKVWELEEGRG